VTVVDPAGAAVNGFRWLVEEDTTHHPEPGIHKPVATSSEFSWSPTTLPVTIAASGSATLTVTYAPTAAGTDTGCIAVTSDASNGPTTNLKE
jgi:hypothetical protein